MVLGAEGARVERREKHIPRKKITEKCWQNMLHYKTIPP